MKDHRCSEWIEFVPWVLIGMQEMETTRCVRSPSSTGVAKSSKAAVLPRSNTDKAVLLSLEHLWPLSAAKVCAKRRVFSCPDGLLRTD